MSAGPDLPAHIVEHAEDLTEIGNAARFVTRWHEDVRWVPEWQTWLVWTGTHWARDVDDSLWRKAREVVEGMRLEVAQAQAADLKPLLTHVKKSATKVQLAAMLALASHEYPLCCPAATLDAHPDLLATPTGTLELATGQVRQPAREDLLTQCLPIGWDAQAACPRWEQFLTEVFGPDPDLLTFVHRAVGYTLTGRTSEQRFFFCYGTGANGKSVFLGTLRALLGSLGTVLPTETIVQGPPGSTPHFALAMLRGVRGAFIEEVPDRRLHDGLLKAISSGEPLSARFPYERFSTFTPQATLWLAGNHRPAPGDWGDGIGRRAALLPFAVTIPEGARDPDLLSTLRAELPGILSWAMGGALSWYQHRNSRMPEAVQMAVDSWRHDTDVLGQFLAERCVREVDAWVPAKELYEAWQTWAKQGDEYALSMTAFGRKMTERGITATHHRDGFRRHGIRLNDSLPY